MSIFDSLVSKKDKEPKRPIYRIHYHVKKVKRGDIIPKCYSTFWGTTKKYVINYMSMYGDANKLGINHYDLVAPSMGWVVIPGPQENLKEEWGEVCL